MSSSNLIVKPTRPTLKPAKKLNLLLHNSPLAMIEWDSDLVIVGWNAAAAEMFSFFEDEAIGQRVDHLLAQREIADLEYSGDQDSGPEGSLEDAQSDSWTSCDRTGILREHNGLNGKKRCRWFNTPFMLKGQRIGTMATIVDITHQTALSNEELRSQLQSRTQVLKHATNRLRSAMQENAQRKADNTFLSNLLNSITSPLFVKNANHQLILANDAFCDFVGRSREDMLGKTDRDFMPQSKADVIWAQDEHVLVSGHPKINEDYFTDSKAQNKFISTTKTRFYNSDSQPHLLGTIRDLTGQVIAQKALKENENRLKKLTANVPGMLYQFHLSADLKPSFPFVSSNSEALFSLSPAQIKAEATALIALIHPDDKADFDRSIAQSAQTLQDWQWQGRFNLSDGRTVSIQGASRPERLADNSILWDGLLMDISDSKQAEADLQKSEMRLRAQTKQLKATLTKLKQTQTKLIQSEKMSSLGQLVAGIAHEINNPVNFIHGNLTHVKSYSQDMLQLIRLYQAHYPTPNSVIQQLIDDLELDYVVNDLPKLLNSLQEGTRRIREIVLSLRNFSRLDETGLKRSDLHEGLENSLMLLSSRLKETVARPDIEIVKAYECVPAVDCFASQLNQVFMNILSNAIDAIDEVAATSKTRDVHKIVLQSFQKDNRVVVQIMNTGAPIPEEVAQRMFDPFFTTKPVGQGTGMGLAISYQTVVGLHKGTLEYAQTADQKTTFTIEIPISQVV